MPANRPSVLKATLVWFVPAFVASALLFSIGLGGNPVGLVIITAAPWLFWLGPLVGALRARRALDAFAEEIPSQPEASCPLLGYPTLSWPGRGLEVEGRFRGPAGVKLVARSRGEEGVVKVAPERAREAARALLEGRVEQPARELW